MKKHQPTHLYRYKNSKNYFFRIRKSFFQKIVNNSLRQSHFVSSLSTSDWDEALWLARFIKRQLTLTEKGKDTMEYFVAGDLEQNVPTPMPAALTAANIIAETNFEANLRLRFKHFLRIGKSLLNCHIVQHAQLTSLRAPSSNQLANYSEQVAPGKPIHPSINKELIEESANPLSSEGLIAFQSVAIRRDAKMLASLISALSSVGKRAENFDFDQVSEPEVGLSESADFLATLSSLSDFTNFMRSKERMNKKRPKDPLKSTYDRFIAHKSREVKPDTVSQYNASFDFLINFLSEDFDVHAIDRDQAVLIKEAVMQLSANRQKGCDSKKLAVKTVNRYLKNFGAFMTWCQDHIKYGSTSPFAGLLLNEKTGYQPKRRRFTGEELEKIKAYSPKDKREARKIRISINWFPLIGMYTAMRLNEIAGIRLTDILVQDGINYFDLTERHLKSEAGERFLPIHSKLEGAGFLEYVQKCREAGHEFLFQELHDTKIKPGKYGFGEPLSRWFNRTMLQNIDIDKQREEQSGYLIDFHCLRKTVLNCFKRRGVSAYIVRQLVGHDKQDDITFDSSYGEGEVTEIAVLKRVIEYIDY